MYRDLMEFEEEITEYIFLEEKPEKSDVIFIPGNGYPQMAEHAAALWREGYAPYILPSGKHSITEQAFHGRYPEGSPYQGVYTTEWEFLSQVLKDNQVPEEAILKEDQATYTYENALLSKKVLDQAKITVKCGLLCCKSQHARRCKLYYETVFQGADIRILPTDVDGLTKDNWTKTEQGIDEVLGEVTRILKQFNLMMQRKCK